MIILQQWKLQLNKKQTVFLLLRAQVRPTTVQLLQYITSARKSNLANNSLRVCTSRWAEILEERAVNPFMSAYNILYRILELNFF